MSALLAALGIGLLVAAGVAVAACLKRLGNKITPDDSDSDWWPM